MAGKPMTGQAFFVLTALAGGPRHGYGIVGEVAELSGGRMKPKIGSLYGHWTGSPQTATPAPPPYPQTMAA